MNLSSSKAFATRIKEETQSWKTKQHMQKSPFRILKQESELVKCDFDRVKT